MKYLILLAILANLSLFAVEPLQKAENDLIIQLDTLDVQYNKAKARLIVKHVERLEVLLINYTKKGDFDKAMEVKKSIKDIDVKKPVVVIEKKPLMLLQNNNPQQVITLMPNGDLIRSWTRTRNWRQWKIEDGKLYVWPTLTGKPHELTLKDGAYHLGSMKLWIQK